MLARKIQTLLEVRREAKLPLFVGTVILVFLAIFTKSQASSRFEALISAHFSKSQMDVRPSVQKTLRTMAFSRYSTGDPDIPSSSEMTGKLENLPEGIPTSLHLLSRYDGHLGKLN